MRKRAGIITAMLLAVPALASAAPFTLSVNVTGGNATGKYVTVTDVNSGAVSKITGGNKFIYLSDDNTGATTADAEAQLQVSGGAVPTFSDSAKMTDLGGGLYDIKGAVSVKVVFAPETLLSFTIQQYAKGGGIIRAQLPNNTTTIGDSNGLVTGLSSNSVVPLMIQANAGYQIDSVTGSTSLGAPYNQVYATDGSLVSEYVDYTVVTGETVTASFSQTNPNKQQILSANLLAPLAGYTGKAVKCSAISTNADATYTFSISGGAYTGKVQSGGYLEFIPSDEAIYTVGGTATIIDADGTHEFDLPVKTVNVTSAIAYSISQCASCHSTSTPAVVNNYFASQHGPTLGGSHAPDCTGCHTSGPHTNAIDSKNVSTSTFVVKTDAVQVTEHGENVTVNPGSVLCTGCHAGPYAPPHVINADGSTTLGVTCAQCHTTSDPMTLGTGDAHSIQPADVVVDGATGCVNCHSVAQKPIEGKVDDNNGVRAITTEFAKWSHHVSGVTLQDAHCAACHLEGKVSDGKVVVDATKHMADATTHLRNADTDADMVWDPMNPNQTTMDTFCMSCHDNNGATSPVSQAIQGVVVPATGKTASASNPFGDTISNRYDKMQRPAVVDVSDQFNTTNNSHHAVKGARYSGRTADPAGPRTITGNIDANNSGDLAGTRSTIYDAGNFNALYVPLGTDGTAATGLGDDSTLHCGDCHTVGQWKAGVATNGNGELNTVAIGAHGSNNEYMLRNTLGTDARHQQNTVADQNPDPTAHELADGKSVPTSTPLLVCYNCHAFNKYGSIFGHTSTDDGVPGPHAGEYAQSGRCNGPGNTISFAGYTTGTATDGTQFESRIKGLGAKATGESTPDFGNIFGIQCANCHNSGVENGYGGIHGSYLNGEGVDAIAPATPANGGYYVDGMGNVNKMERFLPGLGNAKYVPGTFGGITGGTTAGPVTNSRNVTGFQTYTYTTGGVSNDANWEQKSSKDAAGNFAGAGCYTLGDGGAATEGMEGQSVDGGATTPEALGTWGGCEDHNAAQGTGNHGIVKKIVRPVTY